MNVIKIRPISEIEISSKQEVLHQDDTTTTFPSKAALFTHLFHCIHPFRTAWQTFFYNLYILLPVCIFLLHIFNTLFEQQKSKLFSEISITPLQWKQENGLFHLLLIFKTFSMGYTTSKYTSFWTRRSEFIKIT